jgi:hypothetical protein
MSLARRHRDRILAAQTVSAAAAPAGGAAAAPTAAPLPAVGAANPPRPATPAQRAAAEIGMRLTHDLRRLKEIKSIDRKIEAKREMLPEYKPWTDGVLAADDGVGTGIAAEVVPTCMVWLIDIGSYDEALDLASFVLRHDVQMPTRYLRDAATIIVEEIAGAAIKIQNGGGSFPLAILDRVAELTAGVDMHDEVRAKLQKASGIEQLREAEAMEAGPGARTRLVAACETLRDAQRLHDRIGVKDRIKRAEKLIEANLAAMPPETDKEPGGAAA